MNGRIDTFIVTGLANVCELGLTCLENQRFDFHLGDSGLI